MTTTILWDEDDFQGLLLEPEERLERTIATVGLLRAAATFGEIRRAELPGWAEGVLQSCEEQHRDDVEEEPSDDTDWEPRDLGEVLVDAVPLPWDAASLAEWLDRDVIERHMTVSGASPGGHSDGYTVADRDALFADLLDRDYELEHRPGFVKRLTAAL